MQYLRQMLFIHELITYGSIFRGLVPDQRKKIDYPILEICSEEEEGKGMPQYPLMINKKY